MSQSSKILGYVKRWFSYLMDDYGFTMQDKWTTDGYLEFEKDLTAIRVEKYWDGILLVYIGLRDAADQSHFMRKHDLNDIVWYQLYQQGRPYESLQRIYSYHETVMEQDIARLAQLLKHFGTPFLKGDYSMETGLVDFEHRLMDDEIT